MNNSIQALPVFQARARLGLFFLTGTVLLFSFSNAMAQAGSKESQKLLDYTEDAKEALGDMKTDVGLTVSLYNTLVTGEAEKPESSYKKLSKALKKSEKIADQSRDRVAKMQKQADEVFSAWQQELESYENEQLKELGVKQLDGSKQRFDEMVGKMNAAGDAFQPLLSSMNDQMKFMSRDLSPEAMSALQGPAAEINVMADELFAQIDAALSEEQNDEPTVADQSDEPTDESNAPADQSE